MRWTNKKPLCDQVRYLVDFAFLPTRITGTYTWVWLERYYRRQCTHGNYDWNYGTAVPYDHDRSDETKVIRYTSKQ